MLHGRLRPFARGRGSAIDAAALAWQSAVVGAGGTVSTLRLTLVSNLVGSLNSAGVWAKLDRLWLFAGENTQSAVRDLKAIAVATPVNAPTFTVDRGYAGNGTTSYVNTNYIAGGNYTLNSATMGVYNRTNRPAEGTDVMASNNATSTGVAEVNLKWSDGNFYLSLNDGATFAGVVGAADTSGIWVFSRTASNLVSAYRAGTLFTTTAIASVALPTFAFNVGAGRDAAGAAQLFSTNQIGAAYFGGGLNGTEAASLTIALQAYMTAVGA